MNANKLIVLHAAFFYLLAWSGHAFSAEQSCELCKAVKSNNIEAAKALAKDKQKLNELDDKEIWPLFIAVSKENNAMVQLLIDAGADVDQTVNGMSALIATVMSNKPAMTKVLIAAGANPNIQSMPQKFNAIHLAVGHGRLEVLKELLKSDVDLELEAEQGFTALSGAAAKENKDIVRLLLGAGANPNHFDAENFNAMHFAAMSNDISLVDLLIKHGGDINAQKNNGPTPLSSAASTKKNTQMIEALIARKADVSQVGEGLTALHASVANGGVNNLKALLKMGVDPDLPADGFTALAFAVHLDNVSAVKELLSYGADPKLMLGNGMSIIELAADEPKILKLLKKGG